MIIDELELVGSLTWDELIQRWKAKESEIWSDYIKEHGLHDWEDYRFGPQGTLTRYHLNDFHLNKLTWREYKIPDLPSISPRLYTGPFRSWTKYNKISPNAATTFYQIVLYSDIKENENVKWTIQSLLRGEPSFGIGLYEPEGGVISLIDGHHTFTAVNVLVEEHGFQGELDQLRLYLCEVPSEKKKAFYDLIEGRIPPTPIK